MTSLDGFRAEVREWLAAHVPVPPLPSLDTAEGSIGTGPFALAGPIYAGTNEIQRTLIAERVLGLPR